MANADSSSSYRRFWSALLDRARAQTNLHARTKAGGDWWISAARGGFTYNYALRKDSAYVELWIESPR